MAGTATRRRKTKYQKLQSAKKRYCKGSITKAALRKVANEYIKDAVKKGNKTAAQARASANKVVNGGCSVTTKKRKTTSRRKKKVA